MRLEPNFISLPMATEHRLTRLLATLAVALSSIPRVHSQIDNRASLGMNLFFHTDYNNSLAFTDIVPDSALRQLVLPRSNRGSMSLR